MWSTKCALTCGVLLAMTAGVGRGDLITNSPDLPPAGGAYLTPAGVHATYSGPGLEIVLKDIRHYGFSNIVRVPFDVFNPSLGTHETFDSILEGLVSVNSSPFTPVVFVGSVAVDLYGYTPGDTGIFQTEMVAMQLVGNVGPHTVTVSESSTNQSQGSTTVQPIGPGLYRIDSFFDVFTELSIDGGLSIPSNGPTRVELGPDVPEPSSIAALASLVTLGAGTVVIRRRSSRRCTP